MRKPTSLVTGLVAIMLIAGCGSPASGPPGSERPASESADPRAGSGGWGRTLVLDPPKCERAGKGVRRTEILVDLAQGAVTESEPHIGGYFPDVYQNLVKRSLPAGSAHGP